MRHTPIFSLALALAFALSAPLSSAEAQKPLNAKELKTFKPGARGFRKPPKRRGNIKDLNDKSKKRREPPGAKKKGSDGDGEEPGWKQNTSRSEERPTLSVDFLKNCVQLPPGVRVHLDIYDEEMDHVVKLIACLTNKNIILDKPLKGKKITIYSPRPVTGNEAYRAFLTALEANGLTISKQGKFLQIVPIGDVTQDPLINGAPPNENRMFTKMLNLKHVDATEISEVLKNYATKNAKFVVYGPTNSLIITETGSNLRKLQSMLQMFDIPGGKEKLWTYQIEFAEAQDIATKITEIFEQDNKGKKKTTTRRKNTKRKGKKAPSSASSSSVGDSEFDVQVSSVTADERTNRLFIKATARSYAHVKRLIKELDTDIPGDGQVHIHQLNHAKAADLSSVLSSLSQEQRGRSNSSAAKRRTTSAKKGKSAAKGSTSSAALFEGEISVTADEDTNSLVITASLKDYISLKKVINQLDRPRRQVFIEAIIMEVSIRNTRKFGISAHGGTEETVMGETVPVLIGSQTAVGTSLDITSAAGLQGLAAAAFTSGKSIEIGGVDIPSFGVLVNALAQSTDVNILSTPHILTTDNEEAEIVVGSNVPFVSSMMGGGGLGGAAGGMGGFFPTVNIQRTDVALTLKLTPRVNAANYVTLEIDQVIEEIEGLDETLGPTTSKRSIKNTVTVKDQNTVVIGGLQKTRQLNGRTGIPILGEIPVIGYLFRSSTKEQERRNLLLMLTPYVIESEADFQAIYRRKMEEHREFLARFHKDGDEIVLGVDYGKKHGLLEAINKSLAEVEAEEQMLEELRRSEERPPLPQELDGIDIEGEGGETQARDDREDAPKEAT